MMEVKKLVPELRFKGFDEEWAREKFGKLVTNKSGKFNPTKEISFTKCVELEHLATETGRLLGYIDGSSSGSIKNKFNEGDVLFGKLRPYLRKYLHAKFEGVCSSEIWVLKGLKLDNSFLYTIVQTDKFIDLANQSSGSKMPRADWNVVENGIFSYPSLPEQQKIASFLSAVDEKIQQLTRKKELLEQYKKGVMQQLFSGKLRFKDENGEEYPDWEEKRLGELVKIKSGNSPSEYQFIEDGKYPFIKVEELNNCNKYQIKSRFYSNDSKNLIESKSVIFPKRGAAILNNKVRINIYPILMDSNMMALIPFKNMLDTEFLYSQILKAELFKIADTSSIPQINNKHIEPFIILTPCLKEQQKIANFLSDIDKKIESITQQINHTQTFKKGLLQKMFV